MASFFDFRQQPVKTRACVALARSLGRDVVRQRDLRFVYRTLPEFRNICAHGERLYCARAARTAIRVRSWRLGQALREVRRVHSRLLTLLAVAAVVEPAVLAPAPQLDAGDAPPARLGRGDEAVVVDRDVVYFVKVRHVKKQTEVLGI